MEDIAHLDRMAAMVLAVPGLTPAADWALTQDETEALARALTNRNRKG